MPSKSVSLGAIASPFLLKNSFKTSLFSLIGITVSTNSHFQIMGEDSAIISIDAIF